MMSSGQVPTGRSKLHDPHGSRRPADGWPMFRVDLKPGPNGAQYAYGPRQYASTPCSRCRADSLDCYVLASRPSICLECSRKSAIAHSCDAKGTYPSAPPTQRAQPQQLQPPRNQVISGVGNLSSLHSYIPTAPPAPGSLASQHSYAPTAPPTPGSLASQHSYTPTAPPAPDSLSSLYPYAPTAPPALDSQAHLDWLHSLQRSQTVPTVTTKTRRVRPSSERKQHRKLQQSEKRVDLLARHPISQQQEPSSAPQKDAMPIDMSIRSILEESNMPANATNSTPGSSTGPTMPGTAPAPVAATPAPVAATQAPVAATPAPMAAATAQMATVLPYTSPYAAPPAHNPYPYGNPSAYPSAPNGGPQGDNPLGYNTQGYNPYPYGNPSAYGSTLSAAPQSYNPSHYSYPSPYGSTSNATTSRASNPSAANMPGFAPTSIATASPSTAYSSYLSPSQFGTPYQLNPPSQYYNPSHYSPAYQLGSSYASASSHATASPYTTAPANVSAPTNPASRQNNMPPPAKNATLAKTRVEKGSGRNATIPKPRRKTTTSTTTPARKHEGRSAYVYGFPDRNGFVMHPIGRPRPNEVFNYNPDTIASDVLRVMGCHPTKEPLNYDHAVAKGMVTGAEDGEEEGSDPEESGYDQADLEDEGVD